MAETRLIGVDWGTSNLRVMRLGDGGAVLESRSDPRGAAGLAQADFRPTLESLAGDWLETQKPVLVCGMAGARGRWIDMGYVPCPADVWALAEGLGRPEPDRDWFVIPGVARQALTDVMRGEETQAMGLDAEGDLTLVAPGTHSKWITISGGRIDDIRTYMTGEMFQALKSATILGDGMGESKRDEGAFLKGVDVGLDAPVLSRVLFSVRTEQLAGRLAADKGADYLSGLLIGAEISGNAAPTDGLRLVGTPELTHRYRLALARAGFPEPVIEDGVAVTARGLWRIWEARGA